jgi:hypothetical protein
MPVVKLLLLRSLSKRLRAASAAVLLSASLVPANSSAAGTMMLVGVVAV